jgi:hypothetical protein
MIGSTPFEARSYYIALIIGLFFELPFLNDELKVRSKWVLTSWVVFAAAPLVWTWPFQMAASYLHDDPGGMFLGLLALGGSSILAWFLQNLVNNTLRRNLLQLVGLLFIPVLIIGVVLCFNMRSTFGDDGGFVALLGLIVVMCCPSIVFFLLPEFKHRTFWALVGTVALLYFLLAIWKGRPVVFWLLGGCVLLGTLQLLSARNQPNTRFRSGLWRQTLKGAHDNAVAILIGLALVCTAQVVLSFMATSGENEARVRLLEATLIAARQFLKNTVKLSLPALGLVLLPLILITWLWPCLRLVKRLDNVQRWAGRSLLVLTIITSFTFFSAVALSGYEPEWIASRNRDALRYLEGVLGVRHELVAAAIVQQQIQELNPVQRNDFALFFRDAARRRGRDGIFIVNRLGVHLAEQAIRLPVLALGPESTGSPIDSTIQKMKDWADTQRGDPPPSLETIRTVGTEAERLETILSEAKVSTAKLLKASLNLPDSFDPFVKPFLDSFFSAFSKALADKIFPTVRDFERARQWVSRQLKSSHDSSWTLVENPTKDRAAAIHIYANRLADIRETVPESFDPFSKYGPFAPAEVPATGGGVAEQEKLVEPTRIEGAVHSPESPRPKRPPVMRPPSRR